MNSKQLLINKLSQMRPDIANNPMFQAIQSNNSKKGEEIADNLCRTYGVTREQAIQQAKQFFGIR